METTKKGGAPPPPKKELTLNALEDALIEQFDNDPNKHIGGFGIFFSEKEKYFKILVRGRTLAIIESLAQAINGNKDVENIISSAIETLIKKAKRGQRSQEKNKKQKTKI